MIDPQSAIGELFTPPHSQPFIHVEGGRFRPVVCEPQQGGGRIVFSPRFRSRAQACRPAALGCYVLQVGASYYDPSRLK